MNLPGHRIRPLAASAAFWAWCALVSYPMIVANVNLAEAVAEFTISPAAIMYQVIGLSLFLATMCIAYHHRFVPTVGRLDFAQLSIVAIICLSFVLQLHGNETATLAGILYTVLLLATAWTLSVLWTLDNTDLERCMSVAAAILCVFGIAAIAILGWPQNRAVGSIQPNLFATPLLAAFIFSQFRPGVLGIVVRILCLGMVALVSSRFALIGCITALVLHEMTFNPLSRAKIPALFITAVAVIVFWPQIASILALDDSTRGFSSGFSGRDDRWHLWLETMPQNPFGIGFKRAIGEEAGHNGYMKLILEFGIPGGGLLIFFLVCSLALAGAGAVRRAGKSRPQHRFDCARFGGLAAVLFSGFFQPQLFSLGDAFAVSVTLLLFKPGTKSIPARKPVMRSGRAVVQQL